MPTVATKAGQAVPRGQTDVPTYSLAERDRRWAVGRSLMEEQASTR